MNRWIRGLIACGIAIMLLEVQEIYGFQIGTPLFIILSTIIVFAIVFPPRSQQKEAVSRERIVNLHDNSVGEVFDKSKHPDYQLLSKNADGNDYSSPSGTVICTKFVKEPAKPEVKSVLGRFFICIVWIAFILVIRSKW